MDSPSAMELDTLLSSLITAISALKTSMETQGFPPFRSDDLTPHPLDAGIPDPVSFYARRAIVGLCQQITILVQDPAERSLVDHFRFVIPGCLAAATETSPSIAETVLAAGSEGISLKEVSEKTGVDAIKLRSISRMLANGGYLKEVSVGHVVPTRLTRSLAPGGGPVVEMNGIIPGYAPPATIVPQVLHMPSDALHPTAFEEFFKTPFFSWLENNPLELKRFHRGMTEIENHLDKGILVDVHLDDLGPAITLVDIGAGHGGLVMQFLKRHPGWKAILQDRAEVIPEARQFWQDNMPEALDTGRISFLPHSFFEPTPLPPAPEDYPYVFLIKAVLHNWPDDTVKLMLQNLVPAAPPGTKLLIVNFTPSIPDGAHSLTVEDFFKKIKGKSMREVQKLSLPVPMPLNVGFGAGAEYVSNIDVLMMLLLNSRARTTEDFKELLESTSWRLEGSTQLRGASSVLRAYRV
ncbi:S-adenosyl-L-methionine-dependent methyltransferase [Calocera viscosa TUFC12733]|uniref:S-adenosyl-L-methionine-dependent methyltransferase n=1 Tax=Calocera viscosa (strain TUFC12733) TaxID=1330018 RepID=A0A167FMF0_CALVF|nr:S-adenosyl-L-methionine-dependent methyltransferase [Calocera viscosa TUFC12733]